LETYKLVSETLRISHQVSLIVVKRNLKKRIQNLEKKIHKTYLQTLAKILAPPIENPQEALQEIIRDKRLWRSGKRNNHW
jgi:hypothetical protein